MYSSDPLPAPYTDLGMAYNIAVRVFQPTDPSIKFDIIEQGVFTPDSYWSQDANGLRTLKMTRSGTSGALRFLCEKTGENFVITLGVHNYHPWGDLLAGLGNKESASDTLRSYYRPQYGGTGNPERVSIVAQTSKSVTHNGRTYSFVFTVTSGNDLDVDVKITPQY